jgi:hypothetical protein
MTLKFEEDRYSWRERNEIVMRRQRTLWGRYWGWVGKHQWPARVVLVIATVTIAYLALVLGYLIGVGLFYRIGSS